MEENRTLQDQMDEHYRNWKQSGLSQVAYSALHQGLTFHKFNYWVRKIEQQAMPTAGRPNGFLTVKVKAALSCSQLEIIRPDGTRIQFHGPVEVSFLKGLLG